MDTTWKQLRTRAVYEDNGLIALDKPAGVAVVGDNTADDLLTLASASGEILRPAHRIDKVTSGVILLAKSAEVHAALARQLHDRTVEKLYLAMVAGDDLPAAGVIDLPLTTGRKNRVRIAGQRDAIGFDPVASRWSLAGEVTGDRVYPSETRFTRIWSGDGRSLLAVHPVTGRRHQIRVHLAWIGHPIVGDPLFAQKNTAQARTMLHSWRIAFDAVDGSGHRVQIDATPDAEFRAAIPLTARELDALLLPEHFDSGSH